MKRKSLYFFTISFLFFHYLGFSQNCDDISDWMNTIKREYPNLQLGRAMPMGFIENLAVNLYSDIYYVPLRGKSFTILSQNVKTKDWRKIQTCYVKENYKATPYKNWVFQSIIYKYHIDFRNNTFINKIEQRNQLRKELDEKHIALSRNDLDLTQLQSLKKDLETKYIVLFPSEINAVAEALKQKEASASESLLTTAFQPIQNLPLTYASIDIVLDYKSKNAKLIQKLTDVQQQKLISKIDTKLEDILEAIMPQEDAKLEQVEDVDALNKLLKSFRQSYAKVYKLKNVKATLAQFTARKTEIVSTMMPEIQAAIKKIDDIEELLRFDTRFLSDVDPTNTNYTTLKAKIKQQQAFIAQENIRLAQEKQVLDKQDRLKFLASTGKEEGAMQLNTTGFYYAEFFDYLYRGHSENLSVERDSEEFLAIFSAYIAAFSRNCQAALPENKVEIMELVCNSYTVTSEALSGFELYRNCNSWVTRGSGIFVKPELYKAKVNLENAFTKDVLAYLADTYTNPNALGNNVDKIHQLKRLKNDMVLFFSSNQCTGDAIDQLEKNLYNYAMNLPLQRLKGISPYEKMRMNGAPSGEQNIEKLISTIVQEQSETWAANKYILGSITNIRSFKGQDKKTIVAYKANYIYTNKYIGGKNTGAVTIRLKEGLPDCVIFADFPNNCKKPSASILMAYSNGEYLLKK
jgi:hypothetical protein